MKIPNGEGCFFSFTRLDLGNNIIPSDDRRISFGWIIDGFSKPQSHNLSRNQALNLIHQKIQLIYRGYLVLGVVIGAVISGTFGLPDDSDSDLVEISSCKNITSIKIFHKD